MTADDIFDLARAERERAHAKHGYTSMESSPPDTLRRLAILTEEIGEVAKEFNDAEHDGRPVDLAALRKELIQVAAMAGAWADACSTHLPFDDDGVTYCGIDGRDGCGELWPCATVRARNGS